MDTAIIGSSRYYQCSIGIAIVSVQRNISITRSYSLYADDRNADAALVVSQEPMIAVSINAADGASKVRRFVVRNRSPSVGYTATISHPIGSSEKYIMGFFVGRRNGAVVVNPGSNTRSWCKCGVLGEHFIGIRLCLCHSP